jgi:hypothetical protein
MVSRKCPSQSHPRDSADFLLDAIDRGLKQNLGLLLSSDNTIAARGERWKELSNLLPNVSAKGQENVQQTSLIALRIRLPGLPSVIGPFTISMRARI